MTTRHHDNVQLDEFDAALASIRERFNGIDDQLKLIRHELTILKDRINQGA